MMSLVAYNSSDESDSETDLDDKDVTHQKVDDDLTAAPVTKIGLISNWQDEAKHNSNTLMFATLPPPKSSNSSSVSLSSEDDEEEVQDHLTKDDPLPLKSKLLHTSTSSSQKGMKQPVKITVPSISEFQDDEPSKKKFKPSKSGSGLIGMLPSPHNALVKEKKLIPPSVSKRPLGLPKTLPKSVLKYFKSPPPVEPSEDDDNEASTDFFSLSTPSQVQSLLLSDVNNSEITTEDPACDSTSMPENQDDVVCQNQEISLSEIEPQQMVQSGTPESVSTCLADISQAEISSDFYKDEGFMRLQGKRNRRMEDISIIDVHADQHLPDSTLYLKSISEEQPYRASANNMPSAQHRRKHQITYLAYQAKERELELKNQWANNRMSRYQTQAKYGF